MRSFNKWLVSLFEIPEVKIVRYANGQIVPMKVLREFGLA